MQPHVTVIQQGREAQVVYTEDQGAISGTQEFGGGDVIAIVWMGSTEQWQVRHAWAMPRRAQILRFVADELIRQKAPGCRAEIDEAKGDILLRGQPVPLSASAAQPSARSRDAAWMARRAALKTKLALAVLVAALVLAAGAWVKTRVLVVASGPGTPMGSTLRSDTHLATLIQTLQPYTPSLQHDPSTERNTLSLYLLPLDGSAPSRTVLMKDLRHGGYSLARVMGSDGRRMWVSANGLHGVDLRSQAVVTEDDLRKANAHLPSAWFEDTRGADLVEGRLQLLWPDRSRALAVDPATLKATSVAPQRVARPLSTPSLSHYMAAGAVIDGTGWLGLHSASDLERSAKPGRWLRPVESARDADEPRRLMRGELEADSDPATQSRRIRSMAPLSDATYLNAAFLRPSDKAEPLRLSHPDSLLMLHTLGSAPSGGTLAVSRVGLDGKLLWTRDTGLHRFKLQQLLLGQVLQGQGRTVFVGTRPPVPNQLSEPLLVILDQASGKISSHSLWQ